MIDCFDINSERAQLMMQLSDAIALRDMLVKEIDKAKPLCDSGQVHRRLELLYPLI